MPASVPLPEGQIEPDDPGARADGAREGASKIAGSVCDGGGWRAASQPTLDEVRSRILAGAADSSQTLADGVAESRVSPAFKYSGSNVSNVAWAEWDDPALEGARRGGGSVWSKTSARTDVCMLWVHGGLFEDGCSGEQQRGLCSRLAADTGMAIVCPDHLLSGRGRPYKAEQVLLQLRRNFEWLRAFDPVTSKARASPARVIIGGDSSGGTQALSLVLLLAKETPESLYAVLGVVLVSPLLDLTCGNAARCDGESLALDLVAGGASFSADGVDCGTAELLERCRTYIGSQDSLEDCILNPYGLCQGKDPALLRALERAKLPIWMCAGSADFVRAEVVDFAERLKDRLLLEVWVHEAMFHCWPMHAAHGSRCGDAAREQMKKFLLRVLSAAAKPGGLQRLESPVSLAGVHQFAWAPE